MKTQPGFSFNQSRCRSVAGACQGMRLSIGGLVLLLAGFCLSAPVRAAQIFWTNTLGGNWNAATNWSPNQVPGTSDDAVIDASGTYTVTLDISTPVVNSLVLGGASGRQTLTNGGHTLTLNQASAINSNGVFALNGGVAAHGLLTVQGQLIWSGGSINTGSVLAVATNGLLVLGGGSLHFMYGIITNAGTIQLPNGGGDFWLYGSCEATGAVGELVNLPGALVDVQGNNSIFGGCGTEMLLNQGLMRKSGGTGTTTIGVPFTNSGTLDVQTGTVTLNRGGGNGVFQPEAGATLIFPATYQVDSALSGAGTTQLNGGTFTLNGNIIGANVVLNGANLRASNTVLSGALTWNSGNINAGSTLTVATNGLLTLASGNMHIFYGALTNAGTIQMLSGGNSLWLYGSCQAAGAIGALVNLPGALVDLQGDSSISAGCGSTELVLNQGLLRKSGGTGASIIGVSFTNNGTLEVQTGTVNLNTTGRGSGLFLPQPGATLIFSRNFQLDGALTGAGTNLLNGGTFTLNGDITASNVVLNGANLLAGNTVLNGALTWKSGNVNPGSVLTVATNGLLALTDVNGHPFYGILTNAGTVQLLNGSGDLLLNGGCQGGGAIGKLVNLPGALVDVQGNTSISGPCGTELVVNQGTVRKSGGAGTTLINVLFTNAGTLEVQTGTVAVSRGGQGSGAFLAEAGATLAFLASYEVDSALTGAGTNLLTSGTFTLNGNINGSNVVLNGANLLAGNTVINGALVWSTGTIIQGSVLTVATNGLLALAGGGGHVFYGILTNEGTIQLLNGGGDLWLYGSCKVAGAVGELVNLPGALVDVQGNNSILGSCGTALVVNQGIVCKSGGTGASTISALFTNTGTAQVNSGTFGFSSAFTQTAGQTVLNGGNIAFTQVAQLLGGALTGAGTITGSVSNNAAIGTGASPGLLAISGNYSEGANAHLAIKLGGTSAGTNYDQLSIGGTAALAGTLDVSYWNGFTPSIGNVFTVVAGSARTGAFSAINSPANQLSASYTASTVLVEPGNAPPAAHLIVPAQALAGHPFVVKGSGTDLDGTVTNVTLLFGANVLVSTPGTSAQVNFSSDFPGDLTLTAVVTDNAGGQGTTNATVTITTLPRLTLDPIGFQSNRAFKLLMLGDAGTNYEMLASTNLTVTNWTNLGTMESTNGIWRFLDTTVPISPQRFYRARQLP